MQGQLADASTVDLCLRLAARATTGTLVVSTSAGQARLVFADGHLAGGRAPETSTVGARLGDRLVAVGRLAPASLEAVLAEQTADVASAPLGQRLVDHGLVSRDVVRLCLQEQALDALQEVAGWLEGTWEFQASQPMGGVAVSIPVDRALREVARRTVDRQQMALQRVGQPADRESTAPSREEFDLSASPTTGMRPAAPTDGGWTHSFDPAPMGGVDEPEPWVGWANGAATAAPEPTAAPPGADAHTRPPVDSSPESPPVEETTATHANVTPPPSPLDADTRRELFSALHEVGQSGPQHPAPATPPSEPVTPSPDETVATPEAEDEGQVDIPAPAPPASLSRSDVSELLAELHALNLDDDGRG